MFSIRRSVPRAARRCKQQRSQRRQSATHILEAEQSLAGETLQLPPHLLRYGRQVRREGEYSGPGLLCAESEEGCVEYKLRLSTANPTRFQHLVSACACTRHHCGVLLLLPRLLPSAIALCPHPGR